MKRMKGKNIAALSLAALLSTAVVRAAEPDTAAQLKAGKQTYDYWCATCHGPGLGNPGQAELPGTAQLRIKYRGTNISPLLEERTDMIPEFVKAIVRQGISFMPHFRKTELDDAQLDELAAYLTRNNPK
jgi:mono/diheme cytochrome c family protein